MCVVFAAISPIGTFHLLPELALSSYVMVVIIVSGVAGSRRKAQPIRR